MDGRADEISLSNQGGVIYNSFHMNNIVKKPYFIWDYDLSEETLRSYLTGSDFFSQAMGPGADSFPRKHCGCVVLPTIDEIANSLPQLRLRPQIHTMWQRALAAWGYHAAA